MPTSLSKSVAEAAPPKPANAKPPDIASASVSDTLAALHVNPDTGLTHAGGKRIDFAGKRTAHNEVAVKKWASRSPIPSEILGNLGVDARTDHDPVSGAQEISGPRCGGRIAGYQRRVEFYVGAPSRWRG